MDDNRFCTTMRHKTDPVWNNYTLSEDKETNTKTAACRSCGSEVSPKVERLKSHLTKCPALMVYSGEEKDEDSTSEDEMAAKKKKKGGKMKHSVTLQLSNSFMDLCANLHAGQKCDITDGFYDVVRIDKDAEKVTVSIKDKQQILISSTSKSQSSSIIRVGYRNESWLHENTEADSDETLPQDWESAAENRYNQDQDGGADYDGNEGDGNNYDSETDIEGPLDGSQNSNDEEEEQAVDIKPVLFPINTPSSPRLPAVKYKLNPDLIDNRIPKPDVTNAHYLEELESEKESTTLIQMKTEQISPSTIKNPGVSLEQISELSLMKKLRLQKSVQLPYSNILCPSPDCDYKYAKPYKLWKHVVNEHKFDPDYAVLIDKCKALLTNSKHNNAINKARCPYCKQKYSIVTGIMYHVSCTHKDKPDFADRVEDVRRMEKDFQQMVRHDAESLNCTYCWQSFKYHELFTHVQQTHQDQEDIGDTLDSISTVIKMVNKHSKGGELTGWITPSAKGSEVSVGGGSTKSNKRKDYSKEVNDEFQHPNMRVKLKDAILCPVQDCMYYFTAPSKLSKHIETVHQSEPNLYQLLQEAEQHRILRTPGKSAAARAARKKRGYQPSSAYLRFSSKTSGGFSSKKRKGLVPKRVYPYLHQKKYSTEDMAVHCPVDSCAFYFAKIYNLLAHLESAHRSEENFPKLVARAKALSSNFKKNNVLNKVVCPYCRGKYNVMAGIVPHIAVHHKDESDVEDQLEIMKKKEVEFQKSMRNNIENFKCQYCGDVFKQADIKEHIEDNHMDSPDVEETLVNLNTVISMENTDVDMTKYIEKNMPTKCQFCTRLYPKNRLKSHKACCDENPNRRGIYLRCHRCCYQTRNEQQMKDHKAMCEIENAIFTCPVCKKEFNSRSSMFQHKKFKHTEFEPHKCTVCSKEFPHACRLRRHMRGAHSDEKPCICHICGQGFKEVARLNMHINMMHHGKYRYHCEKCGHGKMKKKDLQTHVCGRVRRTKNPYRTCSPQHTHVTRDRSGPTRHEAPVSAGDVVEAQLSDHIDHQQAPSQKMEDNSRPLLLPLPPLETVTSLHEPPGLTQNNQNHELTGSHGRGISSPPPTSDEWMTRAAHESSDLMDLSQAASEANSNTKSNSANSDSVESDAINRHATSPVKGYTITQQQRSPNMLDTSSYHQQLLLQQQQHLSQAAAATGFLQHHSNLLASTAAAVMKEPGHILSPMSLLQGQGQHQGHQSISSYHHPLSGSIGNHQQPNQYQDYDSNSSNPYYRQ